MNEGDSSKPSPGASTMVLDEQSRMIRDTVAKFVGRELMPLEQDVLKKWAAGEQGSGLTPQQHEHLRSVSKSLGLWGLDAPEDMGGLDLPAVTMVGVNEELGRTPVPFI